MSTLTSPRNCGARRPTPWTGPSDRRERPRGGRPVRRPPGDGRARGRPVRSGDAGRNGGGDRGRRDRRAPRINVLRVDLSAVLPAPAAGARRRTPSGGGDTRARGAETR